MGTKKRPAKTRPSPVSGIADALFTKVQQRVLAVLFGNPDRSFYANEVIALAGSGTGTRVGKQKHYQANRAAPVFEELRGLVLKTSGLIDTLRAALAPLTSQIQAAFVYGSVAKGQDTAKSDIDLMVVSDSLSHADLFGALEGATQRLGRTVNPTVYSRQELDKRIRADNAFIKRVLSQPMLWVIGEEHGLAA